MVDGGWFMREEDFYPFDLKRGAEGKRFALKHLALDYINRAEEEQYVKAFWLETEDPVRCFPSGNTEKWDFSIEKWIPWFTREEWEALSE